MMQRLLIGLVIAAGDLLLPPGIAAERGMAAVGWDIDELAASGASLLANGSYDVVVGNPGVRAATIRFPQGPTPDLARDRC